MLWSDPNLTNIKENTIKNAPENIVQRLYREIGLPEPQVAQYPSFDDLIEDYANWKDVAQPMVANYWSYQYPILYPHCYWVRYHLYDEEFQFDLTRKANEQGCYVYPVYKSKIDIKPSLLHWRYLTASIDAVLKNQINAFDKKVGGVINGHGAFFEKMQDALYIEDPENQMSVKDYILLGGFSWLMIERDILKDMRRWIKQPACDEHYQNVKSICDSGVLFVTFRKIVFWINIG